MNDNREPSTRDRPFSCLILEDDPAFAHLEARVVREAGGEPVVCGTLAAAGEALARGTFDLVLMDNHLPDGKAYDWFGQLQRCNPGAPAIMITGLPALAEAITLTRNGIFDYLTKPVELDALAACIARARLRMRARPDPAAGAGDVWLGDSPAMQAVRRQLEQAARHRTATVLLTGESGTGKDIAAQALHRLTLGDQAAARPMVALNCAALPSDMFEAELFGAERGAYTGADRRRPGLAAAAQDGTLFLDEVAEVPAGVQAKLLRFLENREFRALGATGTQPFTGRFVAATNKSLAAEVAAGRFREDLLYRLEVLTIALPPLRERREDIPALAERMLHGLLQRYERAPVLLRAEDLIALQQYHYPGNIRELRNILERALLRTPDDSRWLGLDPGWMPRGTVPATAATPAAAGGAPAVAPAPDAPLPPERLQLPPLEAQEYRLIRQTLAEVHGGIRRAAARLGLSPQALLRRLEKWPELRPTDPA